MSSALDPFLQNDPELLSKALQVVSITRYLTAIGSVLMLYDHALTLSSEVAYTWRAPSSFGRNGFLINKYLTVACMLMILHLTNAFNNDGLTDVVRPSPPSWMFPLILRDRREYNTILSQILHLHSILNAGATSTAYSCQRLIGAVFVLSVYSIGFCNLLVLLRVAVLWDRKRILVRSLLGLLAVTVIAELITVIITMAHWTAHMQWSPIINSCVATQSAPLFVVVWAIPLPFGFLMLCLLVYNSLSKPRLDEVRLTKTLYRDGALFFLALLGLELLNFCFTVSGDPLQLIIIPPFVWSMATLILNRFLLHIREVESTQDQLEDDVQPFADGIELADPRRHSVSMAC